MWAALPLGPLISSTAVTGAPRRHLLAVGRGEIGMGEGGDAQEQRQLSGSDVLMALQRATANKFKDKPNTSRRNDNDAAAAAGRADEGNRKSISQSKSIIIKNPRPLCINPQWEHQLNQLETRLHQLPHS